MTAATSAAAAMTSILNISPLPGRIKIKSAGLGGVRQQLGPVLEVHRVVMIPGAAPDEPMPLEHPHDLDRDAVFPHRLGRMRRPAPVVRKRGADVDRCRAGV